MKLVYEKTNQEVKVGDKVKDFRGDYLVVKDFAKPHKPSSSGRVYTDQGIFYVGVIGAKWINRGDQ